MLRCHHQWSFELDVVNFQDLSAIGGLIIIIALPGYWLYRDAERRQKNGLLWVTIYGLAAIPPTRLRFIIVPLVFLAWFLLRDQEFRWYKTAKRVVAALLGSRRRW
jgi:hypothetical protein